MRIKTLEVNGIGPAIHAMRNPYDSWDRSDTIVGRVGPKDRELSEKLANAGPEHAKHLRMIDAWAEIWAPRYWWMEADTYRMGVDKVSCSTMHTIMHRPLTLEDFEPSSGGYSEGLKAAVAYINNLMDLYKDPECLDHNAVWNDVIQLLPQSFIQRRTVRFSYAALRAMYHQREGHRLDQWRIFRDWCIKLPESWMITGVQEEKPEVRDEE